MFTLKSKTYLFLFSFFLLSFPAAFSQETIRYFYDRIDGTLPGTYLFINEFDPAYLEKDPFCRHSRVYYNRLDRIVKVEFFEKISYRYCPSTPKKKTVEIITDSTDDEVLARLKAEEKGINDRLEAEYQVEMEELKRKNAQKLQEIKDEMKKRAPEETTEYEYDSQFRLIKAEIATPQRLTKKTGYHIVYGDELTGDVYRVKEDNLQLIEKIIFDSEGQLIEKNVYNMAGLETSSRYFFYDSGHLVSFGDASKTTGRLWTRQYYYEHNNLTGYIDYDENNEIIKKMLPGE